MLQLLRTLSDRMRTSTSSVALPEHVQANIISLAAILLEYPVAYVLSSADQTAYLSGVTLDVYECVLAADGATEHTVIKFSCPYSLGFEHSQLTPQAIATRMKAWFLPRLGKWRAEESFEVRHHTETQHRVAL